MIDTRIRSPNHSPHGGHPIRMIVVHATAGRLASDLAQLTSPAARVSAHALIGKDGHTYQLVPDDLTAWHAGVSQWRGLEVWATAADGTRVPSVNPVSIGIELENLNTGRDPYPEAQVAALLAYCRERVAKYGIAPENVVRHLDVAIPRGRKSDPAGFDWAGFRARLFPSQPPPAAGLLFRVKVTSWVRPSPFLNVDRAGSVPQGAIVNVLGIEPGDKVVHPVWGTSDQWAKLAQGYVWFPQLAAV